MPAFFRATILPLLIAAVLVALAGLGQSPEKGDQSVDDSTSAAINVVVFSKTQGYRHESIPAGIKAIQRLGDERRWNVFATEDAAQFVNTLDDARVIVFLNTTGDILDAPQQDAVEGFIRKGGGFVGVHAATDTEYDWAWYGELVGARFASHPKIQQAAIEVIDRSHASTRLLPARWQRTDEWYNFRTAPEKVKVLAALDESSYEGGSMNGNHPIIWCHEFDGGRAWYTACGHTIESYAEELFPQHLAGGIEWAAGRTAISDVHKSTKPQPRDD